MGIIDRAKNIILTPKTEWPVIAGEEPNVSQVMTAYVLPLALIPAIASIIGYGIVGLVVTSFRWGIAMGLVQFITALVGVYVTAFVIDFLAPNFGSQKNIGRAVQLVAYAFTPVWVAGIFYVIPALGILVLLAGLYGLYLIYLGLPALMKTPQDKTVPYLVVSIIVVILAYWVISMILTVVFLGIFGLSALTAVQGI